jgi:predicted flap endonuclease-1-like 5' DNA nuclease
MAKTEFKNGPDLAGWAISAGVGVAAFGISMVLGDFTLIPAVAIAAVLFTVVGLILGLPKSRLPRPGEVMITTPAIGAIRPAAPSAGPVTNPVILVVPAPATATTHAPEPAAMAAAAAPASAFVAMVPGAAPAGPSRLDGPRGGMADDLKEIEGIGPALEGLCNDLGIYHFDQIAHWSETDVVWVDDNMPRFKGRILRDGWVVQARMIVSEGLDAFRMRVKTNDF